MPLFLALLGWFIVIATIRVLYFGPWGTKLGAEETFGRRAN
jgi:hypothetical protein